MIAKIPAKRKDGRSSFKDLTDYCLGVTGHSKGSVVHTGFQNLLSLQGAALEMEGTALCNVRCGDPVFHFILSWREFESPTNEQVDEAVAIALKELDLHECQALWALQSDTENMHVHVAVNRVHPDTFAAIAPAGGWSKKALERAARKIEFVQGWEVERSGRYDVSVDGIVIEKEKSSERKLSSKAADMETHTGLESLERIAKRDAAAILRNASSWEELHKTLADCGFILERKGNGAVLCSGDFAVKLSSAARDCSMSKLEARLGKYRERGSDINVCDGYTLRSLRSNSSSKELWNRYTSERSKYITAKKKAFAELRAEHKSELSEMYARQRELRAQLAAKDWRGKGHDRNVFSSLIAMLCKRERLDIRDAQKQEITELKEQYPQRFPSFKRWLACQDDQSLFMGYRYDISSAVPACLLTDPRTANLVNINRPYTLDLRDYTAKRGGRGSLLYCRSGKHTADFEDSGRTILMNRSRIDEVSVTAALQLAAQKWGAVQITGSNKEYRELCVSLALKHGIKLANEDLSAEVERRRAEQRNQRAEKPTPVPSSRPSADVKEITEADIKALKLISDDARIYLNPRTDNQKYDGPILHVDIERGFCVQQIGRKLLFVHKLEKFEAVPEVGKDISIFYKKDDERVKVMLKPEMRKREIRR